MNVRHERTAEKEVQYKTNYKREVTWCTFNNLYLNKTKEIVVNL